MHPCTRAQVYMLISIHYTKVYMHVYYMLLHTRVCVRMYVYIHKCIHADIVVMPYF